MSEEKEGEEAKEGQAHEKCQAVGLLLRRILLCAVQLLFIIYIIHVNCE